MIKRICSAACLSLALAGIANAGTITATFHYTITFQSNVDLANSQLIFGGYLLTKNAPFDQILAEASTSQFHYASDIGSVASSSGAVTKSGSFVVSASSLTTTQQPVANLYERLETMYIGTVGSPNGVAIAFDSVAGNQVIAANLPWAGNNIPVFVPSTPTTGTVGLSDAMVTQASVRSALTSGDPAAARAAAHELKRRLAMPSVSVDGDEEPAYALAVYDQLETATAPAAAALYRRNIPMTSRPLRLVKFVDGNNAIDAGTAQITISGPLANLAGDFNGDDALTGRDIDALFAAQPGAVPGADGLFDTNHDDRVVITPGTAGSDVDYWVHTLAGSEYGDSNLDGHVNFDDLLALAQNYNATTGTGWSKGDFNGDAAVDFADLLVLAQHYQSGSASDFNEAMAYASAFVPEPTVLGSTLASLTLLNRRRLAR